MTIGGKRFEEYRAKTRYANHLCKRKKRDTEKENYNKIEKLRGGEKNLKRLGKCII